MFSKLFKKNKAGFTLVELMAVVLIIGILVAVAIPVYNNSSVSAKNKACKANIRTILGAVEQYNANNTTTCTSVAALTPTYIKTAPKCPVTQAVYADAEVDLDDIMTTHFAAGATLDGSTNHAGL